MRVFLEINIWINRLNKEDTVTNMDITQSIEDSNRTKMWRNGKIFSPWPGTSIVSWCWVSVFLVCRPSSLDWNYTACFPGPPSWREQISDLLSLHNWVSQFSNKTLLMYLSFLDRPKYYMYIYSPKPNKYFDTKQGATIKLSLTETNELWNAYVLGWIDVNN